MSRKKSILVCPMDWGLGHATRMVPVIETLLKYDADVILGADKRPYEFLKQRFPHLRIEHFSGYTPRYPTKGSVAIKMLTEMPEMLREAERAHDYLEDFVRQNKIDCVISDNRYELWSKQVKTIFITHQLNIQTPKYGQVARPALKQFIYNYIRKHDELWIPDYAQEPNLSGALSHLKKYPIENYHFIGPLSRFQYVEPAEVDEPYELVILLSGPEPQRTILEVKLKDQAYHLGLRTLILQGRPEENNRIVMENVEIVSHLPDELFAGYLKTARLAVSRPGYSTLMDLVFFGKKAVFIPTPGQTEQEYIADYLKQKKLYYFDNQKKFDLEKALIASEKYKGLILKNNGEILDNRIRSLIKEI